ncbi:MAG: membrane protein insertase YidC [Candidatus Omnitrophota bacterium]
METKRLLLAFALMIIVVAGYNYFFTPKPVPVSGPVPVPQHNNPTPGGTSRQPSEGKNGGLPDIFSGKTEAPAASQGVPAQAVAENIVGDRVTDVVVDNDLFTAVFTSKGAGLKSFTLKKYKDDKQKPLELISNKIHETFGPYEVYPFYFSPFESDKDRRQFFLTLNSQNFAYSGNTDIRVSGNAREAAIEFRYANVERNVFVSKRFTVRPNSYVIQIDYTVTQNGRRITDAPILFGPDLENTSAVNRVMQSELTIATYNGDKVDSLEFKKVNTQKENAGVEVGTGIMGSNFYWSAYETTYFAAIFKTREKVQYAVVKTQERDKKNLYSYLIVAEPRTLHVFLGPKDERVLSAVEKEYQIDSINRVIDYGSIIGPIAKLLHKGIVFIYDYVPNMGWAIILFTIFIKIILFPLTHASSVSMAKTQTLQPKINAIKKKYKNMRDPEQRKQMNMDVMALYKQEKVNPVGGCLPMLLQLPILFAFFKLFPVSISFRHQPWIFWIKDLSVKDPFYLLPILMGVSMIIVSKMSPTTTDGGAQKYMMYFFPILMTAICINYSSGLNLYWFVSNLLQMGQQYYINEKVFKEKKEEDRERRALKRKKGGKTL